jgi:hypothetical protein
VRKSYFDKYDELLLVQFFVVSIGNPADEAMFGSVFEF